MAKPRKLGIDDCKEWVAKLPTTIQLEGAPANGEKGRIPDVAFIRINRDLGNLPRDVPWLVRPEGTKGGVIMLIPSTPQGQGGAIQAECVSNPQYLPGGNYYERERDLMRRYAAHLDERTKWLDDRSAWEQEAAQRKLTEAQTTALYQRMGKEGMEAASNMQKQNQELMVALAKALEEKVEANATAEMSRQVGYTANRIIDAVTLWRINKGMEAAPDKNAALLSFFKLLPDEWQEDLKEWLLTDPDLSDTAKILPTFMAWRRHEHAQPEGAEDEEDDGSE